MRECRAGVVGIFQRFGSTCVHNSRYTAVFFLLLFLFWTTKPWSTSMTSWYVCGAAFKPMSTIWFEIYTRFHSTKYIWYEASQQTRQTRGRRVEVWVSREWVTSIRATGKYRYTGYNIIESLCNESQQVQLKFMLFFAVYVTMASSSTRQVFLKRIRADATFNFACVLGSISSDTSSFHVVVTLYVHLTCYRLGFGPLFRGMTLAVNWRSIRRHWRVLSRPCRELPYAGGRPGPARVCGLMTWW